VRLPLSPLGFGHQRLSSSSVPLCCPRLFRHFFLSFSTAPRSGPHAAKELSFLFTCCRLSLCFFPDFQDVPTILGMSGILSRRSKTLQTTPSPSPFLSEAFCAHIFILVSLIEPFEGSLGLWTALLSSVELLRFNFPVFFPK